MTNIKQQVLRIFGDEGADTIRRYFTQIEYTAYWSIRMLRIGEGIEAVIPEGVEDVVVLRTSITELRQIKTRDESRGPWQTSEVLPILCPQYHRRNAFQTGCHYHFVSDQIADNKTRSKGSLGRLYRLKFLLQIEHDGQIRTEEEEQELKEIEDLLAPKICETLLNQHAENADEATARSLLHDTWIETDDLPLQDITNYNLAELQEALAEVYPGSPTLTMYQLEEMYVRVILMLVKRITKGKTMEERRVERDDVLKCRSITASPGDKYPNLDDISGESVLDKKAIVGGFDATELPVFRKQKVLADWTTRKLKSLGLAESLERFRTAIIDAQVECRNIVCRQQKIRTSPGPIILDLLRTKLADVAEKYFANSTEVDEQFCLGIVWSETDACSLWWHGLHGE